MAALRKLVESLLVQGDLAEAIRLGREVVRRDPLGEDGYRLLMLVHDAAGDRAGAVRVYHECVTILRSELGVEPGGGDPRHVRRADARGRRRQHRPLPPPAPTSSGRGAEWTALTRCWSERRARRTPPRPSSRVNREWARRGWPRSWRRGVPTGVRWSAEHARYPTEGDLGYGVVLSWLRTTEQAEALRRLPAAELAELARLLPELGAARATPSGTSDGATGCVSSDPSSMP